MLPQGTAEKFLLAGLSSLKAIIYKGDDYISTMYNLTPEDAKAVIEYARQREEELVAERAAQQSAPAPKAVASASPEGDAGAAGTATEEAPVASEEAAKTETTEPAVQPEGSVAKDGAQ
jgi:hypothetical protein